MVIVGAARMIRGIGACGPVDGYAGVRHRIAIGMCYRAAKKPRIALTMGNTARLLSGGSWAHILTDCSERCPALTNTPVVALSRSIRFAIIGQDSVYVDPVHPALEIHRRPVENNDIGIFARGQAAHAASDS